MGLEDTKHAKGSLNGHSSTRSASLKIEGCDVLLEQGHDVLLLVMSSSI